MQQQIAVILLPLKNSTATYNDFPPPPNVSAGCGGDFIEMFFVFFIHVAFNFSAKRCSQI